MGDSNMDCENKADLMDEDPPLILSNGIREVFHIFTNMLDVKSFMRLAMTSKEMYDRCMNDRRIKINVNENEVSVETTKNARTFCFESSEVSEKNIEKYHEKLSQLKCNVSLKRIHFQGRQADPRTISETSEYLRELGVKRIDSLKVDGQFTSSQQAFIKKFHIKNVDLGRGLPEDVLRSLLQLKLISFTYRGLINGQMLLDVDSPIPQITLPSIQLSVAVFTQILWKIQTSALTTLSVDFYSIPWSGFRFVPENYDRPLPEERPLLIYSHFGHRRWFLHWDGAVTLCEPQLNNVTDILKCDPHDFPPALKSNEIVHRALAEKDISILCLKSQFISFFDGIPVLDAAHKGAFPEERPLLCKGGTSSILLYYLLKEDGSVDVYNFEGSAHFYGTYDMEKKLPNYIIGHAALQKLVFDKRIEKRVMKKFECSDVEEFRFLFEEFKSFPHDFRGQLPERRPLVFEGTMCSSENDFDLDEEEEQEYRIVLFEDGTLIHYRCENDISIVHVKRCPEWYYPSALITLENLKEIVLYAPLSDFNYSIDHDVFRDALKGFKTLPFHAYAYGCFPEKPFVFKKTEINDNEVIDQRWLVLNEWEVRKCEWKDGRVTLTKGDGKDFPPILTKVILQDFFDGKSIDTDWVFLIDRIVLYSCLEDLNIFDYDDDTPLRHLPIIFQKEEIKHTCQDDSNDDCDCIDEVLHLWVVRDNYFVTHATWGKEGDRQMTFCVGSQATDMPPALRDKEMFDYLLQETIPNDRNTYWYGSLDDFRSYFEDHMTFDLNHEGPLPENRPLVFKEKLRPSLFWFLRKDNVLIVCGYMGNHAKFAVSTQKNLLGALSSLRG